MKKKAGTACKYLTHIEQLNQLSEQERAELQEVTDRFAFRCNDYYLLLTNWNDPDDPIRRIIIPCRQELEQWGRLDPSDEGTYTIIPGLQHKYNSTALLLVSNVCDGICRYCFRKRIYKASERVSTGPASRAEIREAAPRDYQCAADRMRPAGT